MENNTQFIIIAADLKCPYAFDKDGTHHEGCTTYCIIQEVRYGKPCKPEVRKQAGSLIVGSVYDDLYFDKYGRIVGGNLRESR